MTDKAYIVTNKQQEREVLENLEEKGALWINGKNATNFIPFRKFPYVIYCNGDKYISWDKLGDLDVNKVIVYDGRKEDKMSDKYVVSQEFMNELEEWKRSIKHSWVKPEYDDGWINADDIETLEDYGCDWWFDNDFSGKENNNRLIAIIRWLNGEDVFEVEKPKKWVVRSKECDEGGHYQYIKVGNFNMSFNKYEFKNATRFDTKEEAESWANSHQEVVEVE